MTEYHTLTHVIGDTALCDSGNPKRRAGSEAMGFSTKIPSKSKPSPKKSPGPRSFRAPKWILVMDPRSLKFSSARAVCRRESQKELRSASEAGTLWFHRLCSRGAQSLERTQALRMRVPGRFRF